MSGVEPRIFTKDLNGPPARALRPVIPNNACALRLTAAAGTELAGASSDGTVIRMSCLDTRCSSHLTVVYTPKGFLPHAASLRQSSDHCAIFPTAASRRSLGRISVPMWRIVLSDPLRVVALVGRYPTNKLIRRDLLPGRELTSRGPPLMLPSCDGCTACGISPGFPRLSPSQGQISHVLLTRSPLGSGCEHPVLVRLACIKHAASVRPEPGSNSP